MLCRWTRKDVLNYIGWKGRHTINRYIQNCDFPKPFNDTDTKRSQDFWFPEVVLQWEWERMERERPDLLPYLKKRQDAVRKALRLDDLDT